ncbi:MAG: Ldh family oxidoreductase, partial [Planctomycetes bacterium]|nr:Ldh family oxidoreductase [Planctomycetota bacterium]
CVFMLTIDPARFGGAEHFQQEVTDLCDFVRGCPRVEGVEEILLPGDPERRTMQRRLEEGIPVDDGNWAELVKLAERLGAAVPPV